MNTHQKLQRHIDRMTPQEKAVYFMAKAEQAYNHHRVALGTLRRCMTPRSITKLWLGFVMDWWNGLKI